MRRLHYSSGYVLTSDVICKAVLRYARSLAEAGTADVVSIPVIIEGGTTAYAHFLIGPASQIFSTPVEPSLGEPMDDDVLRDLEARTLQLQPSRPGWAEEMTDVPDLGQL
jgi:hypothetical protein